MKRRMLLIWKEPKTRRRYTVGILEKDENGYTFKYTNPEINEALNMGFKYFLGFEDLDYEYKSEHLFKNINSRLPNPLRLDYLDILNSYNLNKESNSMEILEATKGRSLNDNYEFVPEFDRSKIEFEIAGTKYSQAKKLKEILKEEDNLILLLEPDNESDEHAVKVIFKDVQNDYVLGYVPRYYAKHLAELLSSNVKYSAKIKTLKFDSLIDDEDITVFVKLIFGSQ